MRASSRATAPGRNGARVLVLGAGGFLGGHIAAAFAGAGWEVIAAGRSRPPACTAEPFHAADLAAEGGAERFAELIRTVRPDAVVNAAGAVWTGGEAELHRANVTLVRHLADGLAIAGRRPRVVHLGSSLEYSPAPHGVPVPEEWPARPGSAYGRSKLAGTRILLSACRAGSVDGVVLRVFNAVGAGLPEASLLGAAAARLAGHDPAAGPARLAYRRLAGQRDYVDARDVASATVAAARGTGSGQIINIGAGRAVAARAVIARLIAVSGIPARIVTAEQDTGRGAGRDGARRSTGLSWQQADIGRARAYLRWAPAHTLDDSLRDLWQHAHAGPAGARRVAVPS